MSNNYYNHTTYPAPNAPGSSANLRNELAAIMAGFNKMPTLTGNGYRMVRVNAAGTGMETVTDITNVTINGVVIGGTAPAAATFTNLTVTGTLSISAPTDINLADYMLKDGSVMSGTLDMADQLVSGAVLKDFAIAVKSDAPTVNTIDYRNGSHQVWSPATGAQTLTITNWPPAGTRGELWIEGNGLGAATITTAVAYQYLKSDGTYATTTSLNANQGASLRISGVDNVLLWTRDGGSTIYAKIAR